MHLNREIINRLEKAEYLTDERSEAEKEALNTVLNLAIIMRESLNDEQVIIFTDYVDAMAKYKMISEKEAFIKGIRFATEYILEICEQQTPHLCK